MKEPKLSKLQVIKTDDGFLTPVYKDWEEWHDGYETKMAYYTSIAPGVSKGPILHKKRQGLMSCISGDVSVTCLVNGELKTYGLVDGKDKYILLIPKNIPNMITNNSAKTDAVVLNLPDRSWHPDDEDTTKFSSWDDYFQKYNTFGSDKIINNTIDGL